MSTLIRAVREGVAAKFGIGPRLCCGRLGPVAILGLDLRIAKGNVALGEYELRKTTILRALIELLRRRRFLDVARVALVRAGETPAVRGIAAPPGLDVLRLLSWLCEDYAVVVAGPFVDYFFFLESCGG